MDVERYRSDGLNRGSLGLSVAIVGSLVAAAMLSSPTIRAKIVDRPIEIYPVLPDPPPPPEPLPKPESQARAKPSAMPRETLVETPQPPKVDWTPPPEQPATLQPGTSGELGGGGLVIDPPKPPPPVLTGIEVDPRYANAFQPLYPPAEQRAGRDGVVTLKVLVGVDGRVVRAEQLMATSEEFWRVTLKQALGRWRFRPATRDGVPYEAWRTMTVRFRLDDRG